MNIRRKCLRGVWSFVPLVFLLAGILSSARATASGEERSVVDDWYRNQQPTTFAAVKTAEKQDVDPFGVYNGDLERNLLIAYFSTDYAQVTDTLNKVFHQLFTTPANQRLILDLNFTNRLVRLVFFVFTSPFYDVPLTHLNPLLTWTSALSELVALSSYITTDAPLNSLKADVQSNWRKILPLWNARAFNQFDRTLMHDIAGPETFAKWYTAYLGAASVGCMEQNTYRNLIEHQDWLATTSRGQELRFVDITPGIYFLSSYVSPITDRHVKRKLNEIVRRSVVEGSSILFINVPNRRRVAVVSANWWPLHPIYEALAYQVKALMEEYEVTLVVLGGDANVEKADKTGFARVVKITFNGQYVDISAILQNDFAAVYFPDVGMSYESIVLANMRIAPTMLMGDGHPISTFGSQIDYYMGGSFIEPPHAEDNYSERLVLMPTLSTSYARPWYIPPMRELPTDTAIITCPWTYQKINFALLSKLRDVVLKCLKRKVLFRFFPGFKDEGAESVLFQRSLKAVLNETNFEIMPFLKYGAYFDTMANAHFSIDSLPFGGQTTFATSLHLGVPVVTQESPHVAYGRWGAAQLRKMGLPELVAYSDEEYVSIIVRMVEDSDFFKSAKQKLLDCDLNKYVFDATESARPFKKAVDFLIENHDILRAQGSHSPIVISESP
mmetsp:Transcript_5393/g.8378  ORF Transcript_5393/g.8378 Transcript_5393/m.8378 type:complete len:669 (+) Transcript_5393:57-2063(+)